MRANILRTASEQDVAADFHLRVATLNDRAPITALLGASYSVLMASHYDDTSLRRLLPFIAKANPALLSSGTYHIAESGDRLAAGCGGWTFERPGSGDIEEGLAHIRHFAVHPDWLGRGIGRALYQRCEDEVRAKGVKRFECYSSLNAEGFYAALGFKPVRPVDVPMPDGLAMRSILMERCI